MPRRFGVRRVKQDPPFEESSGYTRHIWRASREDWILFPWDRREPSKRQRRYLMTAALTTVVVAVVAVSLVAIVVALLTRLL